MTTAVVMFTNEAFHPRANLYREGYRHCLVFVHSADGWYGREFRPGAGEEIYPRVAEPDQDLLLMFQGNSPMLDSKLARRRSNVVQTEIIRRDQWRYAWYRKRSVYFVKWVIGVQARQIRRPYQLFQMLSPVEETPKKVRPVVATAQLIIPAK